MNKMKFKKIFSLMLATLMIGGCFGISSCGGSEDGSSSTDTTTNSGSTGDSSGGDASDDTTNNDDYSGNGIGIIKKPIVKELDVEIERQALFAGFDTNTLFYKDGGDVWTDGENVWASWGMSKLGESDVAGDYQISTSTNAGETFLQPQTYSPYGYLEGNINYTYGGCTSCYSKKYDVGFSVGVMGQTAVGSAASSFIREPAYILRDSETQAYSNEKPKKLPFPFESPSVAPHGQPIEFENGDFLLTFYYTEQAERELYKSVAILYSFDGNELKIKRVGTPIGNDNLQRGLYEPSIAKLDNTYYMTLRSNEKAMIAWSHDGLNYSEPIDFTFDNGVKIGSVNTQQRWIRHKDGLFLVYTSVRDDNDNVRLNRAPLFMARFDQTKKCLIKETESVLIPNRGASLATMIGVCEVADNVSYIVAAECMISASYPYTNWWEVMQNGADNSVWIVKIMSTLVEGE